MTEPTATEDAPRKFTASERQKIALLRTALPKMERALNRLGVQGLQRLSPSSLAELSALEKTAHNGGMILIERELARLGTYAKRYLDRDPLFEIKAYMDTLNRVWLHLAMVRRRFESGDLPWEMTDVLGQARRKYEILDAPLGVHPLGASGWVTDTGFVGITVYLLNPDDPTRIYQVSNAKPTAYFGTDPRRLVSQNMSEYCSQSISDFCHSAYILENAKVSNDLRLSMHGGLRVHTAPYLGLAAYKAFEVPRFADLVDQLREVGLNPVAAGASALVFVRSVGHTEVTIDHKHQVATAALVDSEGANLPIRISLRPENNHLIDNLEALLSKSSKLTPVAWFGRVSLADGGLVFHPFTAVFSQSLRVRGRASRVHEFHLSIEYLPRHGKKGER